jgi:hypothetical protein
VLASCIFGGVGFILVLPLVFIFLLFVPVCRPVASGAFIGWFFWFRDYDYGLNVGGPETPLCNWIRATLGVQGANIGLIVPAIVLVLAGSFAGLLCHLLFYKFRQRWRKA